jgi:hypothetical protein
MIFFKNIFNFNMTFNILPEGYFTERHLVLSLNNIVIEPNIV